MEKNEAARILAKIRWSKKSAEERSAYARMMAKASAKVRARIKPIEELEIVFKG